MGISWGKHVADTDLQATGSLPRPCLKAVELKQGWQSWAQSHEYHPGVQCHTHQNTHNPSSGIPVTVPRTHEGMGYPPWPLPALRLPPCSQED